MKVIMDIEANGLLGTPDHHIHCAVFKDIATQQMYEFIGWTDELQTFLSKCTMICAHNGTTFDMPFLKQIYGWEPSPEVEVIDSLIMSRILNPDREPVEGTRAPHGVEAWGKRLGRWKPDHTDWSVFTPEMLHRCKEDVEIQFLIFQMLCDEADVVDYQKSIFDKTNYHGHNWALSLYQEHRSAQIMFEQKMNGVYFEKEKAQKYVEVLTNIVDEADTYIQAMAPAKPKQKGASVNKPFKKDGKHTKAVDEWLASFYPELPPTIGGPFSRVEWNELNIGSHVQLKEWLDTIGWVPDEWNYHKTETGLNGTPLKTSPKLTDSSLEKLEGDIGRQLTARSKSRHRRSQIEGWIGNCRDDHRIEADANPQGTPTGRMRHIGVANVPKASSTKDTHELIYYPDEQPVFFGTEMRSLFSTAPDRCLVGRDASGLELRCFAHYLDDVEYTNQILSGDIHSYNQQMAGLPTRDAAKTFIYAFLYGAGEGKLGSIVLPEGTEAERKAAGAKMKADFLAANPKLAKLVKGVKKACKRGWLLGLDGRKLRMRSQFGRIQESKALNTLLQGAGALIMTNARIWLYDEIKKTPELDGVIKVLDYHDEETYECRPDQAELLKKLMVQSVVQAGKFYKLNCPLDADAQVGNSWAEVH